MPHPALRSGPNWRVRRHVERLTRTLIALCSGVALLLACEGILARYIDNALTFDWTGEVVVFLVIWAVFLSASDLAGRGAHIRVDLVTRLLPRPARRGFGVLAALLGIAVGVTLVWSGVLVVQGAIAWDERTTSSLQIPLWIYYLSLPVGAALLSLRLAWRCLDLLADAPDDDMG